MTRLPRAATVLVVVGVVLLGIGVWKLTGTDTSSGAATTVTTTPASLRTALESATKAHAPFAALTATRIRIGGRSMRVVIADSTNERTKGLRKRRNLGSYRGMLFDFRGDTTTSFTMSTVPVALEIGFYDAAGRVVDRLRMEPCAGSETECPVYSAKAPFRYAIETLADKLPRGRLS